MKDFKKMPKMAAGGKVKKMSEGGSSDSPTKPKYDTSKFMETANRIQRGEPPPPAPEGSKMRAAEDRWKEIKAKSDAGLARFEQRQAARAASKSGGGGSMGGGDMSGMKGLDKPYKRGGKVKK